MTTTTVGVKLDEGTRDRLKKLSQTKQRSTHWLMKEAIAQYLDTQERYEQEKAEDEARWQRYLDTGTHIAHEDIDAWLDELAEQAARKTGA